MLDAALKKRGFATRDILTHWAAMAPKPYDALAMPDQLKWPRGAGHEGATLYLRCAPGHALALSHEAPLIAAAVNRYFGYLLVREVRLSAEPFSAGSAPKRQAGRADAAGGARSSRRRPSARSTTRRSGGAAARWATACRGNAGADRSAHPT